MKFFVHTQKPYPVVMAHDLFDCLGEMVLQLHPRCKVALLCDDDVDAEYGWPVRRSLESESYRPCRIPLPAGEACKAWAVLGEVLEKLDALDVETLTPIEALNFLYELKKTLKGSLNG